jgi:hypothetical protein
MTPADSQLLDAGTAWISMMDAAARHVLALGYRPQEFHIVHQRPTFDGIGGRRVLVLGLEVKDGYIVGGQECFEVVTEVVMTGGVVTVTNTPRVIAWPEARL